MTTVEPPRGLITADEFARMPESNLFEELVRGVVVAKPLRGLRHGMVCATLAWLLGEYAERTGIGRALYNNAGFITEWSPDTVRGPDLSFYGNERLSEGSVSGGYGTVAPELACDVLSPGDRWDEMVSRIADFFRAGVLAILVVDLEAKTAHVFQADEAPRSMGAHDLLRLYPILPGVEVVVGRLFA